jgi:arylsulfatase A-like enzyme
MELTPKTIKGYVTTVTTDIAIDWIENKRDTSRPFYMMLHHKAPHGPWEMDPADEGMLDGVKIPEPETLYDDHKNRAPLIEKRQGFWPGLAKNMAKWKKNPMNLSGIKGREEGIARTYQHYLRHYLGCIHSIDKNVGRVLECLEKAGILDDTLIIYTSDNGMFLGEHTWHDKRMMYEESLAIPMVVRYPREIKPGSIADAICLNLDFPETFLDYAGASIPSDMQGESLRPIFKGKTPADWRQSMFYAYYEGPQQYGIRTKRYKLICYDAAGQHDMFDLEKDLHEMRSVYDDPGYADVRDRLQIELIKLREKYNVTDRYLPARWTRENPDIIEQAKDKKAYR